MDKASFNLMLISTHNCQNKLKDALFLALRTTKGIKTRQKRPQKNLFDAQ